jgi:hypothetical protein
MNIGKRSNRNKIKYLANEASRLLGTVIELNAAKRIDFEAVWTRNKKSNAYFGFKAF